MTLVSNTLAQPDPARAQGISLILPPSLIWSGLALYTGTFPPWLASNVPQLVASCQCTVGIKLDGERFTCPKTLPSLTRQAQAILHRFESLQCITDDTNLKGVSSRQLIPIWVAAAGPGQRPMLSRAEHKQQVLQWHLGGQQHSKHMQQQHHKQAVAGAVIGVLAAVVLTAGALLVVLKRRWQGWSGPEVRHLGAPAEGLNLSGSRRSRVRDV